jgi:hypothetical protein
VLVGVDGLFFVKFKSEYHIVIFTETPKGDGSEADTALGKEDIAISLYSPIVYIRPEPQLTLELFA